MEVVGQRAKRSLTEQKINVLQTDLVGLFEEEEYDWESNHQIPGYTELGFCFTLELQRC